MLPPIAVSTMPDSSDPNHPLWGDVQRRPLRRVALSGALDGGAPSDQSRLDLARLWQDIQDLSAHEVDAGLVHLLQRLSHLLGADGIRWELLGSPQPGSTVCVASQVYWDLQPNTSPADMTGPELSLTLPMRGGMRMHFNLMRAQGAEPFDAQHRAVLEMALAGLSRWLNWLTLSHGPAMAAGPLPPHQRKVLLLLLTGLSEKQIASELNLSTNTAHQYVTSLYRRFGVRNRPSLTAQWLGTGF